MFLFLRQTCQIWFKYFFMKFTERPEEPIDHRSLYDRLQEQKQKKDLEYEEAHKLSMYIIMFRLL